eukprot:6454217-Pyramimonas_sp.AAC.2
MCPPLSSPTCQSVCHQCYYPISAAALGWSIQSALGCSFATKLSHAMGSGKWHVVPVGQGWRLPFAPALYLLLLLYPSRLLLLFLGSRSTLGGLLPFVRRVRRGLDEAQTLQQLALDLELRALRAFLGHFYGASATVLKYQLVLLVAVLKLVGVCKEPHANMMSTTPI